jgi:hypothetical protein
MPTSTASASALQIAGLANSIEHVVSSSVTVNARPLSTLCAHKRTQHFFTADACLPSKELEPTPAPELAQWTRSSYLAVGVAVPERQDYCVSATACSCARAKSARPTARERPRFQSRGGFGAAMFFTAAIHKGLQCAPRFGTRDATVTNRDHEWFAALYEDVPARQEALLSFPSFAIFLVFCAPAPGAAHRLDECASASKSGASFDNPVRPTLHLDFVTHRHPRRRARPRICGSVAFHSCPIRLLRIAAAP